MCGSSRWASDCCKKSPQCQILSSDSLNLDEAALAEVADSINTLFESFSAEGLRTLGVAYKRITDQTSIREAREEDMVFAGFITLFDPLKENIVKTIDELKNLGVQLKVVTGDNKLVAANIFEQMGISDAVIMTGGEIAAISDRALMNRVGAVNVFAELEPNEKERIIVALKKAGFVVGYMGDGINDAAALHVASWRRAPTSATCSAWPVRRSFCRFSH